MGSLPAWAVSIIAAVVLLSPALAFLMALAVEILIDLLNEAGVPIYFAPIVTVAVGWLLFESFGRARRMTPRSRHDVTKPDIICPRAAAPLTAGSRNIQDRVEHDSQLGLARPAPTA